MSGPAARFEYEVRWYQAAFHDAILNPEINRAMAVWHRRAGKDDIVMAATRRLALSPDRKPAGFWHSFPEYKQARKAIWNGVNPSTGKRRIDEAFPPQVRKRTIDDDMFIEFHNGSTWQLLGSDRYDAHVGSSAAFIAYSEFALCNPAAWAYHSPMLRENGGKAVFITTPRGDNHAKAMFDRLGKSGSPAHFAQMLTIDDTRALSKEVLAEALEEYQTMHGTELGLALFEQEYMCSWAGATVGSYWGAEMARAEREGRIRPDVEIDPHAQVHAVMDLGKARNNPVWLFQMIGGRPVIVDFYAPDSENLRDWLTELADLGLSGTIYVPHDIMVTEWGSDRTRMELLQGLYSGSVHRIPRVSLADSLQAGRDTINMALFRLNDRTADGIAGLKAFRREWDEDRKVFRDLPVKDWAEHIASAFRYLGLSWRHVAPSKPKPQTPDALEYRLTSDGKMAGNMDVKQAVEAMMKRRRRR